MMLLASSRNAVVCAPVSDEVVCVLPYRGRTSCRIKVSIDSRGRPLAVQSASAAIVEHPEKEHML